MRRILPLRMAGLSAAIFLTACNGQSAQAPADYADIIFINGKIYTVDEQQSWAQSVAIDDGRIVYVGDGSIEALRGPSTRTIDLKGKMILPGFQDAHAHPVDGGVNFSSCPVYNLPDGTAVLAAIEQCAKTNPDAPVLRGAGWSFTTFKDGRMPTREMLDAIDSSRPLVFSDSDLHTLWVNSKALEVAGINKDTPDPAGGHIERHPDTGEIWGTLHEEAAMNLVKNALPGMSDEELEAGILWAQKELNRFGITAVQDAIVKLDSHDNYRSLPAYKNLRDKNQLNLRVAAALYWVSGADAATQLAEFELARDKFSGGRLQARTVKLWADGVVEVHTAMMLQPYTDKPETSGLMMIPRAEMMRVAPLIDAAGFQLHIHAIGDATVRYALDAVAAASSANRRTDARPLIAHLEFVHMDDIARFGELNVTAAFQPLWAYENEYITNLTRPRVGDRINSTYPMASILHSGGRLAFSSDWAVDSVNPLEGIEVAITRQDPWTNDGEIFLPEQRIGLADAIKAYTKNAAYVNFLDDTTGSIEVGKYADLIVLDRDLFAIPANEISAAKVLLTLLEGETVYGSLDDLL